MKKVQLFFLIAIVLSIVSLGLFKSFSYFNSDKKVDPALHPFEKISHLVQPYVLDQHSIAFYSDDHTGEMSMRMQFFLAPVI